MQHHEMKRRKLHKSWLLINYDSSISQIAAGGGGWREWGEGRGAGMGFDYGEGGTKRWRGGDEGWG